MKLAYVSLVGKDKALEWKTVWHSNLLPKINFFNFSVMHNFILSIDNLKRHGFQMCNMCVLFCHEEEFIPHIFIHCPFSIQIWKTIFS